MRIGVLAVQGDFSEHLKTLDAVGVEGVGVRLPADLEDLDGLILPGGESTTMRRLIERWDLREPILELAATGAPLFGTCAGMIVMAREIVGGEPPILPLLDVTVQRNAFGRQLDSFEAELAVPVLGDRPVHAVFIRAPIVDRVGPDVDVLATLDDGRIVAVRERNIVATAFHPELARRDPVPPAHRDDGGRARRPGRRLRPAAPSDAPGEARTMSSRGKVRVARLTDLAALGELSRLCQIEGNGTRSLGLPVSATRIGMFSLFRLPLGAFRPHDLLYVYEEDGRVAGLLRAERDSHRDEWTVVELDAIGAGEAGDIRFRLVHQLLRDAGRAGAGRIHVACADEDGNVDLFMQAGFMRYGDERVMLRPATADLPSAWTDERATECGIRDAEPSDAVAIHRLYSAVTPQPVQRLELVRIADWERQGMSWRVPRSSLAPILRFADVEAYVQQSPDGGPDGTGLDAFIQVGVAKEDQPHYLKIMARPERDVGPLVEFGLGVIAARLERGSGHRHEHGVLSPVRTYEAPIDRRLEDAGFESIATVTLLLKETLVRVAEPALVPAGVR